MSEQLNPQIGDYSFNEWIWLANNNPEKFELERKKAIESTIEGLPDERQHSLRQLQFRIDGQRRKYKHNGLISAQKMYDEMWASFIDLNEALKGVCRKPDAPKPKLSIVKD